MMKLVFLKAEYKNIYLEYTFSMIVKHVNVRWLLLFVL